MFSRPFASRQVRGTRWWWSRWLQAAVVAVVFLVLWLGRWEASKVLEPDAGVWMGMISEAHGDQNPVVDGEGMIGRTLTEWFPHRTDGVRDPLWPWLAAWVGYGEGGLSGERVLVAQKWFFGVVIALVGVLGVAGRLVGGLGAMLWLVAAGLEVWLGLSGRLSADMLFAVLYGLAWLAVVGIFRRNVLWLYAFSGVLLGLAFMTGQGSVELMLAFLVVGLWRFLSELLRVFFRRSTDHVTPRWSWQRHLIGMSVFLSGYFLTAGPRLGESYEKHGAMFFRTVHYSRWLDTKEEARSFESRWLGQKEEARMDDVLLPSWETWVTRHPLESGWERLQNGLRDCWGTLFERGTGDGISLGMICLVLFGMFVTSLVFLRFWSQKPMTVRQAWPVESEAAAVFVLLVILVRVVICAWDGAVAPRGVDVRVMFAPLMFCLIWAVESVRKRLIVRCGPCWISPAIQACYAGLTLCVLIR